MALASPALFCVATNLTPEDAGLCLSERSCGQHVEAPPPQKILARIFGVQRSSVKLVDRTVRPMEHDTGEIIAKAALGEGGLDPSVRRAVSRRTPPFPEPAPRRGWLAELEAEALLLSDLQTSPSEAQCAHPGIPTHRGVCAARFC